MVGTPNESQGTWRILAVEHGKISAAVIKHLKENIKVNSGQLIHIGGRSADLNISSLLKMSRVKGRTRHVMEGDKFSGAAFEFTTSDWFDDALMTGLDNLQRRSADFKYNHHQIKGFHDSAHYYHIVIDVLANILLQERVNLVLFFDIPHLFYDTLLYQMAKALGVKTLIFTQSIFSNLFCSLRSVDDCGNLAPLYDEQCIEPLTINPNETPNWYYMRDVGQERGELGHLTIRGILHLFAFLLTRSPQIIFRPLYVYRLVIRMHRISSAFPKWRDPFASFFHIKHLSYFESLLEFEKSEIDLNQKYVYFPLQMQPEMTTASLGGKFSDQLLAIEQLAMIVPNECSIYVKENPKQTGKMRGSMFFQRLRRIPNVRMLPSYANTHELTDRAVFVATVTGTVGWEAICKGKNVLVFGMPWYRNLPGVFVYQESLKYEDICKATFDHANLERHAGWLISHLHKGVVSRAASRQIGDFDWESNVYTVSNTIYDVIEGRIDTTFD